MVGHDAEREVQRAGDDGVDDREEDGLAERAPEHSYPRASHSRPAPARMNSIPRMTPMAIGPPPTVTVRTIIATPRTSMTTENSRVVVRWTSRGAGMADMVGPSRALGWRSPADRRRVAAGGAGGAGGPGGAAAATAASPLRPGRHARGGRPGARGVAVLGVAVG